MRSMASLPSGYKMYPAYLRKLGYYCTNSSKEDYNLREGEVWHESSRKGHWKNRPDEKKPFFAIFNFTTSHESQIRKRPHEQVHDPAKVRVPAYHRHPEVRKDWLGTTIRSPKWTHVGAKLKEVKDAGLEEDTIVFYFRDHGSGMPKASAGPSFGAQRASDCACA